MNTENGPPRTIVLNSVVDLRSAFVAIQVCDKLIEAVCDCGEVFLSELSAFRGPVEDKRDQSATRTSRLLMAYLPASMGSPYGWQQTL